MKNYQTLLVIVGFVLMNALVVSCEKDDNGDIIPPDNSGVIVENGLVKVQPKEYTSAIRNPMKGFREFIGAGVDPKRSQYPYPYGTMIKEYMPWNMLEDNTSDGVDKIIAYSDYRWEGVEDINMKIIPRIYIVWIEPWHGGVAKNTYTNHPDDLNGWHWPSDISEQVWSENPEEPITGGYFDSTFQDRVRELVAKAGEAWDNDPRVAYVEMGIIGEWGEHHDPSINTYWAPHDQPNHVANRTWIPGIEETLGEAFTAAFQNKKVMVRYAYDFKDYEFGIYWDSWSQPQEKIRGYDEMMSLGDRWKTQPIGGEITWNWGDLARFDSFEEVVGDAATRDYTIEQIRNLHGNHLGGITWANFDDPNFIPNAEIIQKALGYRYTMPEFTYPTKLEHNKAANISFKITNTGSSPFYYDWPVEIALLSKDNKQKVWSTVLDNVNITEWMPGEDWDKNSRKYAVPPIEYEINEKITLDEDIPAGEYIISIAVLDPAGMLPSLRLAVSNYFEGGRHPIGYIGVGEDIYEFEISSTEFLNLKEDKTLRYELENK